MFHHVWKFYEESSISFWDFVGQPKKWTKNDNVQKNNLDQNLESHLFGVKLTNLVYLYIRILHMCLDDIDTFIQEVDCIDLPIELLCVNLKHRHLWFCSVK